MSTPAAPGDSLIEGYRPDIDGLRGLAIALVCLFHAGGGFTGGYVGVDVFFVISGFVITRVLVEDLEHRRFQVGNFFMRRVRRLAPALLVLLVFASAAFTVLYPPAYLRSFGESLVWQSAFGSNFYFWQAADYFGAPPDSQPLLHTWSLAVEEQFYLVFAFALLLLARVRHQAHFLWFAVAAVASLALSVIVTPRHASAGFYLLPTRAWELFAGALIAFAFAAGWWRSQVSTAVATLVALAGVLAIVSAALLFQPTTTFPGYHALLPVLGTAALIWVHARHQTLVGALLSLRPMILLGKVSYSLYLWHWVALVVAYWLALGTPMAWQRCAALLVALLAAIASWRWIEEPVRKRVVLARDRALLAVTAAATLLVAAYGVWLMRTEGLPGRAGAASYMAEVPVRSPRESECVDRSSTEGLRFCALGAREVQPRFIVIGDSHALSLLPAFDAIAARRGIGGLFGAADGCLPFIGVDPARDADSVERCHRLVSEALRLAREHGVREVILAARWGYYSGIGPDGTFQPVYDAEHQLPTVAESRAVFDEQYRAMRAAIHASGARLALVLQVPHQRLAPQSFAFRKSLPRWLGGIPAARRGTLDHAQHVADQAFVRELLAREPPDLIVDPSVALCPRAGECLMFAGAHSLYFDDDHLDVRGAEAVAGTLEPLFDDLAPAAGGER